MQRRLLGVIGALALTASACTTSQYLRYVDAVMNGHEADAKTAVAQYEAERADATAGRPCAEWYDVAISTGWTPDQWRSPMARTMWGESNCNPGARSPAGAIGLMQVMPMWADDCGGTVEMLYDPEFNLACALHVLNVSSWNAWDAWRPSF
jgi:hypothetical protein